MKSRTIMLLVVLSTVFNTLYINKMQSDNELKVMGWTGNVAVWNEIYNSDIYKAIKVQETNNYIKYLNDIVAQSQSDSIK